MHMKNIFSASKIISTKIRSSSESMLSCDESHNESLLQSEVSCIFLSWQEPSNSLNKSTAASEKD